MVKHKHHIIPKYAGGTDAPANLVELSPEEHALAHKKLWEQHGNWQDYVAWQGLSGIKSSDECLQAAIMAGSKKGGSVTGIRFPKGTRSSWGCGNPNRNPNPSCVWKNGVDNLYAKTYRLKTPSGEVVEVPCLTTFCVQNGLNYNSFHKGVVERKRSHKGYSLIEEVGRTHQIRG